MAIALQPVQAPGEDPAGDSEHEAIGRSALRKATWRLIPIISIGYGLAYMDRISVSFAALRMNQDLAFQRDGLWIWGRALLHRQRNQRSAFEPARAAVWHAAGARFHHLSLGRDRDVHDVCAHAAGVLRDAAAAGHGRGGLLPRRSLLPDAVVSGADACPGGEPLLYCAAA